MAEGYHYGFIYYGAAVGLVPLCAQPFVPASHALVGAAVTAFCLETARFFVRLVHGQL